MHSMDTQNTPKGFRTHIGIFGRRNAGKSSFLNAITKQQVSIVSEIAGTTTDPVEKPMEFLPLGPVLFIDTAGIDDIGTLGELRMQKTRKIFDRTDIGIILTETNVWSEFEEEILSELQKREIPIIIVLNKIDLHQINPEITERFAKIKIHVVGASAKNNLGLNDFRAALLSIAPEDLFNKQTILQDLVGQGECAILVTPIDKEAPKGRLILPEVQAIRDILDGDAFCIVTQHTQLARSLQTLKTPPKLVVTDSQCFKEVAEITPIDIPLTSFSILFSRFKGDLVSQAEAAASIDNLKVGDNVLICEACTHHPISDDIGRDKIPKILQKYVGGELNIKIMSGHDFPDDLQKYKLVIHCGACMWNRRAMLSRILHCRNLGVPFTNYGLTIAHCLGILERTLTPFPEALQRYKYVHDKFKKII